MVGIIAAVAIAPYQDYIIRSEVSSGFNLGTSLKAEVRAFYVENERFPNINEAEEVSVLDADSEHVVSAIVESDNGLIIVQYEGAVNGGANSFLNSKMSTMEFQCGYAARHSTTSVCLRNTVQTNLSMTMKAVSGSCGEAA